MSLFSELKRRNVFKVAIAFLMLSWLILQLVDVLTPILDLPESFARVVFVALLILFPITLIISWAFELTPDGIKKSEDVDEEHSIRQTTGQKINYIIIGFLLLVIGFQFWSTDEGAVVDTALANTIAVMPFADMSADGDQEYFGDGMAEEILNVIVSIDDLDVTSRTTAFSLKEENLSIPEIAERLNVNYILEGSIRSDGNNVRVTAQLIDVANDTHLWSDTYDRELTSIFAIQDEISVAIADALKVELLGDVLGDVPTQNMEAYGLFLQARRLLDNSTFDELIEVGELANQMIKLDPNYADAWSLLASFQMQIAGKNTDTLNDEVKVKYMLAMETAENAINLDANNGYGWGIKGVIHLRLHEWKEAEIALKRSVLVDPKDAANWLRLGYYYEAIGAIDDALRAYKLSLELNPDEYDAILGIPFTLIKQGNIEQTRIELENSLIQLGPDIISSIRYKLSIMEMEQDKSIEQFKIRHQSNGLPTANTEQFINAYYDPSLREETIKLLADIPHNALYLSLEYALLLQDGEFFVETLKNSLFIQGVRGLIPPFRPILNQQVVKDYFSKIGLVDHWRDIGFPTFCRPVGDDDFECEAGS